MSNNAAGKLEPGVYRHFKGGLYDVLGVARHSETEEYHVVYRPLYDKTAGLWVRPLSMFDGVIERDGRQLRRFERAGDSGSSRPASPDDAAQ